MEQEISVYDAAIANLEAERDEINRLIDGLRRRSVRTDGAPFVPLARTGEESEIQHDSFFGMTIADAARKYLGMVKATKSTSDICAALERGGLKHSSKDFPMTMRSTIRQSEGFTRVPNGEWGLTEWYPGLGRGKRLKPKKIVKSHEAKARVKALKSKDGLTRKRRVLKVMETNMTKEWTAGEIAEDIGDKRKFIQATLTSLVKDGSLEKAEIGYRFPKANAA
jgi:hypothetical protein